MKTILVVLFCFLFVCSVNGQLTLIEEKTNEVSKLTLGVEDSQGNIIEDVATIDVNDIPIYCYISLSSTKPTMVMMKIVAVKAKKLRANTNIISVQYKTKKGENSVEFNATPGTIWAEGEYRVDVYLDGELAKSKEFKVENTVSK